MSEGVQPGLPTRPRRNTQGQSIATFDKERRIASALSIGMKIAAARFSGTRFRFWHFDANAGCGWNQDVQVPGSPIAFHAMADAYLGGMQRSAYFCDINGKALEDLSIMLTKSGHDRTSVLLHGDNEQSVSIFANAIRSAENPAYAIGSIIVDPNGYWYRNAKGEGPPVSALLDFVREFPKIDVIVNLNTRTYRLQKSQGHRVRPALEIFADLQKKHWLVARTHCGGNEFLLAVGRNTPTGDHRALGLHRLESQDGEYIMSMAEGNRQGRLL